MENIGDLIVKKRKERGMTQAELGSMLGISGKAVSKQGDKLIKMLLASF